MTDAETDPSARPSTAQPADSPLIRLFLIAGAVLLLLIVAWGSLSGGVRQIPRSHTVGQSVQTAVQLLAGLLSIGVILTSFRWRGWRRRVHGAWTASFTTATGLSALVWGPPMPLIALLFAVVALVLALGLGRALRTALPRAAPPLLETDRRQDR